MLRTNGRARMLGLARGGTAASQWQSIPASASLTHELELGTQHTHGLVSHNNTTIGALSGLDVIIMNDCCVLYISVECLLCLLCMLSCVWCAGRRVEGCSQ